LGSSVLKFLNTRFVIETTSPQLSEALPRTLLTENPFADGGTTSLRVADVRYGEQFHLILPLKRGSRRFRVYGNMYHLRKTRIGPETDVTGFSRLLSYFILYYFIKCDEEKGINRVPIPWENLFTNKKAKLAKRIKFNVHMMTILSLTLGCMKTLVTFSFFSSDFRERSRAIFIRQCLTLKFKSH